MEELVRYIVEHLVSNKDAVKVETNKDNETTSTIYVEVSKEDMGKVIGRQGKIAKALRTLVRMGSQKENKRYKKSTAEFLFIADNTLFLVFSVTLAVSNISPAIMIAVTLFSVARSANLSKVDKISSLRFFDFSAEKFSIFESKCKSAQCINFIPSPSWFFLYYIIKSVICKVKNKITVEKTTVILTYLYLVAIKP